MFYVFDFVLFIYFCRVDIIILFNRRERVFRRVKSLVWERRVAVWIRFVRFVGFNFCVGRLVIKYVGFRVCRFCCEVCL